MTTVSIKAQIEFPKIKFDASDTKNKRKKANAALSKANIKAMTQVETKLKVALDSAMDAKWPWWGNPVWKDGTQPGNPRDIVHTGALKNSQKLKLKFLQTKATITISYNTPYAAFVYYGGVHQPYGNPNAPTRLLPGRPWISAVLEGHSGIPKFDLTKAFNDAWAPAFNQAMS